MGSETLIAYAAVGSELTQYRIDVEEPSLTRVGMLKAPASVQYAWCDPHRRFMYIASSNGGPGSEPPVDEHFLSAYRIDPTGELGLHGDVVRLRQRAIHLTLDGEAKHIVCAYNKPSALSVHRIKRDGTLGDEVAQPKLDLGSFTHQVRVAPSNDLVISVARGFNGSPKRRETPGGLNQFRYRDGILGPALPTVAPDGGYGFGPRHLDFHPSAALAYVALERQQEIHVFGLTPDGLTAEPLFRKNTLEEPGNIREGQMLGAIHVHPNGRFVYASNRAEGVVAFGTEKVFVGGENSIAVFAINEQSGEPTLIQNAPTHGITPRTFSMDPDGRILLAANQSPMLVRDGDTTRMLPASLSLYRIGQDGKLDFVLKYDVDAGVHFMFWMGIEHIPPR